MKNGKIDESLVTLIPELQVDINEVKKYISQVTNWIMPPKKWNMKYHHIDKLHSIYKTLVDQLAFGNPGSIFVIVMFPRLNYPIHVDEIKNSTILVPIDGEFHLSPVNFYKNVDGKEKLFDYTYEIGVPVLINGLVPHGVQNLSYKPRTALMICIWDPYNYESVRASHFDGTLLRKVKT